jgi:hypothetical protein
VDVGNFTSYHIDLPGTQYYFAVQAYTAGATSPLSAEVAESSVIALANPGDQTGAPGFSVSLQLVTTGAPVSYTATNLPGGLSIDSSTGRISGTISAGAAASSPYVVTASVANAAGNTSSVQFKWIVKNGLVFTDDPIIPGTTFIKAVHITELRSRIDAIRVAKGLAPYAWSDPSLAVGWAPIRAQYIVDLRAALAQAYVAAGLSPPTYTDPVIGSGTTVKVAHIADIRSAVTAIE